MESRKNKNYIDSDELDQEMESYSTTGEISERLGQLILELHDHIL